MPANRANMMFLWIIIILISCSSGSNQKKYINKKVVNEVGEIRDSIILIKFADDITIHWDNKLYRIVNDSLFISIIESFPEKQQRIIDQILNTSLTSASSCGIKRNLVVGDLAFLLIDKVKGIPYFQVLGVQWDAFTVNCKYPEGMFDYISGYRSEVKHKIELHLSTKYK